MAITKLFQWLLGVGSFMTVWLAYVAGYIKGDVTAPYHSVILVLPIYLLIVVACCCLAVLGYRVASFNDCVDAAEELQKQIKEARKDLEKKGYKYVSDWKEH